MKQYVIIIWTVLQHLQAEFVFKGLSEGFKPLYCNIKVTGSMLTSCLRCRSALAQDTQHLCAHLKLSMSFCAGVLLKKPAQSLEISSLLYSINTEMKACCETDRSRSNIYKQFICRFVKGDSEVCGGSFLKLGKSAKLVLKFYFTEFTRSLNQKLHCRM